MTRLPKAGDTVVFNNPNSGYRMDQISAQGRLHVGEKYVVIDSEVGNWRTELLIEYSEGKRYWFNSVLFSLVEKEDE